MKERLALSNEGPAKGLIRLDGSLWTAATNKGGEVLLSIARIKQGERWSEKQPSIVVLLVLSIRLAKTYSFAGLPVQLLWEAVTVVFPHRLRKFAEH